MAKMAKPEKAAIIDFIEDMLRKGKERAEILAKIVQKWPMSDRTFGRYLKQAKGSHTEALQSLKEEKDRVMADAAIDELKMDIMTAQERKVVLSQIARGQIPLTKPMVVDGMVEMVPVVPDWMDRRNAIAELNKMEGDYAPTKVAPTDPEGNALQGTTILYLPTNGRAE
jgi:hypothetical protein